MADRIVTADELRAQMPALAGHSSTVVMTGFPNVGKSSFMNKVTRADVDVQPYPFTTKCLYIGKADVAGECLQVVDGPGLLDHPFEHRNGIEMLMVEALVKLRACILFFMDLSGQCGYTIDQQLSLFRSIRPLFAGKPLVVVFNKCDVTTIDDVSPAEHDAIMKEIEEAEAKSHSVSMVTDEGVDALKATIRGFFAKAAAPLSSTDPNEKSAAGKEEPTDDSVCDAERALAAMTLDDTAEK